MYKDEVICTEKGSRREEVREWIRGQGEMKGQMVRRTGVGEWEGMGSDGH